MTDRVMSRVDPSVNVPVAVYWRLLPTPINTVAGVTLIEVTAAGVTVSVPEPLIEPTIAAMVVSPGWAEAVSPEELTEATVGLDDDQVAVLVRSRCDPSL